MIMARIKKEPTLNVTVLEWDHPGGSKAYVGIDKFSGDLYSSLPTESLSPYPAMHLAMHGLAGFLCDALMRPPVKAVGPDSTQLLYHEAIIRQMSPSSIEALDELKKIATAKLKEVVEKDNES